MDISKSIMTSEENQRVKLTKHLIYNGLITILESQDIGKIKINELCLVSGINRSTFYKHYGSPIEVLEEMAVNMVKEIDQIYWTKNRNLSSEDRIESICKYILNHRRYCAAIFRNNSYVKGIMEEAMGYSHTDMFFQNCKEDYDEEEKKYVMRFITTGAINVIVSWIDNGSKKSPKEIAHLIAKSCENLVN